MISNKKGQALTEFILVFPVFMGIFLGLLGLMHQQMRSYSQWQDEIKTISRTEIYEYSSALKEKNREHILLNHIPMVLWEHDWDIKEDVYAFRRYIRAQGYLYQLSLCYSESCIKVPCTGAAESMTMAMQVIGFIEMGQYPETCPLLNQSIHGIYQGVETLINIQKNYIKLKEASIKTCYFSRICA